MSAESKVAAPVDVLAAIEDSINECNDVTCPQCRRLAKARAAVAELVEAAHDYLDHPHDAEGVNLAARDCLRAALDRVQGGAA